MQVAESKLPGRWVPGEAVGDEAAQAVLSSPVKGIVSQISAIPGQNRGAGSTLAMIQSPELAHLKAQWIGAKAKLDRTLADLSREDRMFQAGAGARRDLEAVRSEATTAQAEEEAARLGLEAVGLEPGTPGASFALKAPASGSVVAWKVLFSDLKYLEQVYRIVAFLLLGVLVLCGSFVYLKSRPIIAAIKNRQKAEEDRK